MHTHTLYVLRTTEGNHIRASNESEKEILKAVERLNNDRVYDNRAYVLEKVVTTTEVLQAIEPVELPVKHWDVDSMVQEIISYSEGQREFYYPEEFQSFSEVDKARIKEIVEEALDYCDHCGHLVDAPELSEDNYGSRLCDMCYSDQEEEDNE